MDSITLTHNQGGGYTVKVTVRNQSSIPVTYGNNFHVTVYIDPDQPPTCANIPTLTPDIEWGVQGSWLGAGGSCQREGTYIFNSVGSHTLYAWADPYRVVVESNEDNNERTLTQTISILGEGSSAQGGSTKSPGPHATPTNVP